MYANKRLSATDSLTLSTEVIELTYLHCRAYRKFDTNNNNFLNELKMYYDSVTDSTLSTLVVGLNNDLMTKVTFL